MDRYECKLPHDLLEKAVAELNEPRDNSERLAAIDKLRNDFVAKNTKLTLVRDTDEFILRFLRAKKFEQANALEMLTNYHVKISGFKEVYEKINSPALINKTINADSVVPLAGYAKNGSSVIVGRPGLIPDQAPTDLMANIVLTLDKLLERERVQICGITVISDMAYSSNFAKQMTPYLAKGFMDIIQGAMPIRVKSLNITNEPAIFDLVYALIYPLMKEKMRKRYRLHGQDFSKLYDIVDRFVLPPMFAGSGPEIDKTWKDELLSNQDTAL